MKKEIKKICGFTMATMLLFTTTAFAESNYYNGLGAGQGRTDSVNINDYSKADWERFTYNYQFITGVDYSEELGRATETDAVGRDLQSENVRRNKDVAFVPPSYGVFSGNIDTQKTNPYVQADIVNYANVNVGTLSSSRHDTLGEGVNDISSGKMEMLTPTSIGYVNNNNANKTTSNSNSIPQLPSPSNVTITQISNTETDNTLNTEAITRSDGSIGTLSIPKIKINVKVNEGGNLQNMKNGVAHFEFTSAWDGNCVIAGHNGGSSGYFEDLTKLTVGDKITYSTSYGTRTYAVSYKTVIKETDFSLLGTSTENRLTLITCNKGVSDERYVVIAYEV